MNPVPIMLKCLYVPYFHQIVTLTLTMALGKSFMIVVIKHKDCVGYIYYGLVDTVDTYYYESTVYYNVFLTSYIFPGSINILWI